MLAVAEYVFRAKVLADQPLRSRSRGGGLRLISERNFLSRPNQKCVDTGCTVPYKRYGVNIAFNQCITYLASVRPRKFSRCCRLTINLLKIECQRLFRSAAPPTSWHSNTDQALVTRSHFKQQDCRTPASHWA